MNVTDIEFDKSLQSLYISVVAFLFIYFCSLSVGQLRYDMNCLSFFVPIFLLRFKNRTSEEKLNNFHTKHP